MVNRGKIDMKTDTVESTELEGADVVWIDVETPVAVSVPELLSIREMADQFDVTPRALRFYESKGLLSPTRDRGARVYAPADQQHLALILKGQKLGFTLAEISQMIDASNGRVSRQSLRLTRQKCLDQITMFEQRINDALEAVAELRRIHTSLCCQ
jgi:DNA-binding transcriptional MerR regulator